MAEPVNPPKTRVFNLAALEKGRKKVSERAARRRERALKKIRERMAKNDPVKSLESPNTVQKETPPFKISVPIPAPPPPVLTQAPPIAPLPPKKVTFQVESNAPPPLPLESKKRPRSPSVSESSMSEEDITESEEEEQQGSVPSFETKSGIIVQHTKSPQPQAKKQKTSFFNPNGVLSPNAKAPTVSGVVNPPNQTPSTGLWNNLSSSVSSATSSGVGQQFADGVVAFGGFACRNLLWFGGVAALAIFQASLKRTMEAQSQRGQANTPALPPNNPIGGAISTFQHTDSFSQKNGFEATRRFDYEF